jgi:sterol desaturase/sphingolipid hydroxylase (fatty acid hydroxylase superfamily)
MLLPILALAVLFIVAERIFPDQELPRTRAWWPRVIALNVAQLGMVLLAGFSWDRWLASVSIFALHKWHLGATLEGLLGYFVATFVYYWWHRLRHDWNFLWLLCHQMHHSPARIETVTSFYKHPTELFLNSLLSAATSYTLLGLSIEGAAYVTLFSAAAEFLYHMNIKTPHWLGRFIQRPEMHRVHHRRGVHYKNFGDLPIWDMLFGTYENPVTYDGKCGFKEERETQFVRLLLHQNVNGPYVPRSSRKTKL